MPQIQVLPAVPSFGSRLAKVLGEAGGDIGAAYFQGQQKKQEKEKEQTQTLADQKILEALAANPNASPMDMISQYGKLSPKGQSSLQPLINTLIKSHEKTTSARTKQEAETAEAQKKEAEEQKDWQGVFESLEEKLPYAGPGYPFTKAMIAHFPWTEAAGHREAFDVAAFQLERFARAAHTKGALSTKVYNSLLDKIPSSKLTEAQNRGRINEWKKIILKNKNIPEDLNAYSQSPVWVISPKGQRVQIPADQVDAALANGGRLQ